MSPSPPDRLPVWTSCGRMALPRAGCAVAALPSGIHVAGGTHWVDGRKVWVDLCHRFDPDRGAWSELPPVPRLAGDAAGLAWAGRFLVLGGGGDGVGSTDVWAFDGRDWGPGPALPAPRRSAGACVVDGSAFVVGGLVGAGTDYASASSTLWRSEGGAWQAMAPVPGPGRLAFAVAAVPGRILVAGGCTADGAGVRNLDEVLCYEVAADRWSVLGRLPEPSRAVAAAVRPGGVYLMGGYTDRFQDGVLRLDPSTGGIGPAGRLPAAVADARFVAWGDGLVGLSGEDGIRLRYAAAVRARLP